MRIRGAKSSGIMPMNSILATSPVAHPSGSSRGHKALKFRRVWLESASRS